MALRLKAFADEDVGLNGLLYKAAMADTGDDINGWGVGYDGNTWMSENVGTIINAINGGLQVDATQEASSSYYVNLAIPSEKQFPLLFRGSFQVDYYLSDLTSKSLANKALMQSGTTGTFALGIIDKFDVKAAGAGYRTVTDDYNGNEALVNCVSITNSSTQCDTTLHALPVILLHDGLDTTNGYITYGKSWTNEYVDTFINGEFVNRMIRKKGTLDAVGLIELFKHQLNVSVTQRNMLVYDRPFDDHVSGDLRIAHFGNSYSARDNLAIQDSIGTVGQSRGFSAVDTIGSQLYKNIDRNIDYRCIGISGDTMSQIYDRINDADQTYTLPGAGTYKTPATRGRPHFCIVLGYSNGKGTFGTITLAVAGIADLLRSRGVIPVFVAEHSRSLLPADISTEHTEYITALEAYQSVNDVGIVDMWDPAGGANCDPTWVEEGDASNHHPNMKALRYYGAAAAAEINRLILDPPGYSMLAQGK